MNKLQILAEIMAALPQPYNPDTDITAAEIVALTGIDSKSSAKKLRAAAEKFGLVEVRVKLPNGHTSTAWRAE